MQDEHFQRAWCQSHDSFAQGVDAGLSKLHRALSAGAAACGSALRQKADAITNAVLAGFILGAASGGALLASMEITPSSRHTAVEPASLHIYAMRSALA
jgi:hypothetical protein